MKDALLLVDVINDFRHEDGASLLESFRERHGALLSALEGARTKGVPVIYANDNFGVWDGNGPRLVEGALSGNAGDLVEQIAPGPDDRFVVNPCKGYVPLYSPRNRIFASFVPTRDGLYVGLVGDGFDVPTVPHRASRGGSERMTVGALCPDVETGVRLAAQSYRNDMAKG